MELELKHLSPYLPYNLKIMVNGTIYSINGMYKSLESTRGWVIDLDVFVCSIDDKDLKPILIPLSDLTTEFVSQNLIDRVNKSSSKDIKVSLSYSSLVHLISMHFDVFGLIEQGLAIDINTTK